RIARLQLKAYRQTVDPNSEPLDLVQPAGILPVTLRLPGGENDASLLYRADRTEIVAHGDESADAVLVAEMPGGLRVEKRFRFKGTGYAFEVAANLAGGAVPPATGLVLTPLAASGSGKQGREAEVVVVLHERKVEEVQVTKLLELGSKDYQ